MPRELILFGLVGGVAFIVDVGILYLLKGWIGIYWARTFSIFCAIVVTWLLNRRFTFKQRSSGTPLLNEFARYLAAMLIGVAFNYLVYVALAATFRLAGTQIFWAVAAGVVAGMIFNFLSARYFIFRRY